MRRHILPRALPLILGALVAACDDPLTVAPVNEVPVERAIIDASSARAALAGAYDATQDDEEWSYYAGDVIVFGDLPADDVEHSGTFGSYLEADQNQIRADNGSIEGTWETIYEAINLANIVIARVPGVNDPLFAEGEKDDIIGQAHFLRALHYHNLVKYWGGVPLRLEPVADVSGANDLQRASADEVWAQVLEDLDQAAALMDPEDLTATRANVGAVEALRSRVLLYREDWAGVVTAANEVEDLGYELAANFADLFTEEGSDTPEDIFKITYTVTEAMSFGWYYRAKGVDNGGRYEVAPSCSLVNAFDPKVICSAANPMATFAPTDERAQATICRSGTEAYGCKYPTGLGAEDLHVIRFAEVILNKAEALAQLNQLTPAVNELNRVRVRAGLTPLVAIGMSKEQVLAAIWNERRLELAFEGHRWIDIIRTGRAAELLGLPQNRLYQLVFPIPQSEVDASEARIEQNPGY